MRIAVWMYGMDQYEPVPWLPATRHKQWHTMAYWPAPAHEQSVIRASSQPAQHACSRRRDRAMLDSQLVRSRWEKPWILWSRIALDWLEGLALAAGRDPCHKDSQKSWTRCRLQGP